MTDILDTPEAALAVALTKAFPATAWPDAPDPVDDAAAILAAVDGWVMNRKEVVPGLERIVLDQTDDLARLAEALERADHWIIARYGHERDHACAECVPGGPIVVPGFQCVPHEAKARATPPSGAEHTAESIAILSRERDHD